VFGRALHLSWRVRGWRCLNPDCPTDVWFEKVPEASKGTKISGADRLQERPIRPSGVEESTDPVVAEVSESEGRPLHPLDEIVGCFARPVGDMGAVPGDLSAPVPSVRPSERASTG